MTLAQHQENALAQALQAGVPLVPRPFAALGEPLGLDEPTVLDTLHGWSAARTLREISAVVEGEAVGYESALAAAQVPQAHLEEAVAVINAHPTVTHNYERDHDYNLWFTLAAPVEMGLEATARKLARAAGLETWHLARRTATYKIGVNFDLQTRQNRTAAPAAPTAVARVCLAPAERAAVRALQQPLPLQPEPFAALARAHDVDAEGLLAFGRQHLGGLIRRYAGTLRHRKLGVRANGMVVWSVPPERQDAVGGALAAAPEVSHCYAREAFPGFPYTLFSMVHAPDAAVLQDVVGRLAASVAVPDHRVLVSTREFKKTRLRYFLHELDAWWQAHPAEDETP